jgi:hypothetical protein
VDETTEDSAERKRFKEMRAMKEDSLEQVNSAQESEPSVRKWIRCDTPHCGNPAIGLLALRFFCVGHFISHCYEKLERCNSNPLNDEDAVNSVAVDRFLQQCMAQAGELVRPIRGFDNLDRARLFDVFLWASDLVAKRSIFKIENMLSLETSFDSIRDGANLQFKKAGAD